MSQERQQDWKNHAHWDHGTERPALRPPRWETPALRRFLQRHSLPAHPVGPLALIALGLAHCVMVAALFRHMGAGDPALSFAAAAILGFALVPGVGLAATGAWDLARARRRRVATRD